MDLLSNAYPTYDPNILIAFHELEDKAYRDIVHFFEEHQDVLYLLDVNDYLACKYKYAEALFELGRYHQYLDLADELIEDVIHHNIIYLNKSEDVFQSLLLHKAASHYHLMQYTRANHLLVELLKINPQHKSAAFLYRKSRLRNASPSVDKLHQIGIFGVLLAVIIISVELLVIRSFYPEMTDTFMMCRNVILSTAVASLVLAELGHRLLIYFLVKKELSHYAARKRAD